MCGTCGCGHQDESVKITRPGETEHSHTYTHTHEYEEDGKIVVKEHTHSYAHAHPASGSNHHHDHPAEHDHDHDHMHLSGHHHHHHHDHDHGHNHSHSRQILIEQDALSTNNLLAERNRGYFEAKGIFTLNLVSSPGSGKTSLLEKTITALKEKLPIYVIEGDQQTMNDANRIEAAGAPVVQINTGNGCHLDADMVNKATKKLGVDKPGILVIENVGNLVCPSLFDLGEALRVVIMSVTEGDDKPLKYPTMFETSQVCIINKTDLLPYVDFDMGKAIDYASRINPNLLFFELSVKTGEGLDKWLDWLVEQQKSNT
jgi:hydrogenase nickel incorporation protein HypB